MEKNFKKSETHRDLKNIAKFLTEPLMKQNSRDNPYVKKQASL